MAVDIYPQWVNLTATTFNGVTYQETETALPNFLASTEVLEVLMAEYEYQMAVLASAAATSGDESHIGQVHISARTQAAILALSDPACIDKVRPNSETQYGEATETGGAGLHRETVVLHDFAQGGKGFLVAASSLFLGCIGSTAQFTGIVRARLLVRVVKVTAQELIGMALSSLV